MISIVLIIKILVVHWFADFVCQTNKQATEKSESWEALLFHTSVYSFIWVVFFSFYGLFLYNINVLLFGVLFSLVTFVAHTVTDYITSREAKKWFDDKNYHNGFVVVGLDQILHYLQLIGAYVWLIEPQL